MTQTRNRLRIAIIGYGTGGQAAALYLSADGHEVDVFERAPVLGPVGAGFLLQPVGLLVLQELGVLSGALAHGAVIRRLYGENAAGRPVMDMRYGELDRRLFGLGMQRGALFSLLDAAWQEGRSVHCGVDIVDVDSERGSLIAADGCVHDGYDLVVVADGAASRLRSKIGHSVLDQPYPWGAQWCLVEQGDWVAANELSQRYAAARRMAGMLPVGTRPGDPVPRMSFFWSMPADRLQDDVAAGNWRDELENLWPQAAQRLAATVIPHGLLPARYRDVVHAQWSRGRAVLLGDAAHAMSPQLGQGVNMALLDARGLRDALRKGSSISEALSAYQAARRHHLRAYHFWSRWLTPLFQSEHDLAAKLRDLTFHPMSRLPGGRGQMLRILSGTRRGWFGRFALPANFLDALSEFGTPADNRMSSAYNASLDQMSE